MVSTHRLKYRILLLHFLEKKGRNDDGIPVASSRFSPKVVARGSRLDDLQLFAGPRFFADGSGSGIRRLHSCRLTAQTPAPKISR